MDARSSFRSFFFNFLKACVLVFMIWSSVYGNSFKDGNFLAIVRTNASEKLSNCRFPDAIQITLTSFPGSKLEKTFHLLRHINKHHVPTYVFTSGAKIEPYFGETQQETGLYITADNVAILQMKCFGRSHKTHIEMRGIILLNNSEYIVEPAMTPDTMLLPVLLQSSRDQELVVTVKRLVRARQEHNYIKSEKSIIKAKNEESVHVQLSRFPRDVRDFISVTSFTVEVLAVVDYSVFKTWYIDSSIKVDYTVESLRNDIKDYYNHVIKGVDFRYKNLGNSEFKIHIVLSGVVIIETRDSCPWLNETQEYGVGSDELNADVALKAFKLWINETHELPVHDHAVLFTKYDLYTSSKGGPKTNNKVSHTSGLAFIGTLCEPGNSVSIVEEQGGFQSVGTVAHEIGHSLGALHDGENNTCLSENRYIMAAAGFGPVPETKKYNPWFFSECSNEYFRHFIAKHLTEGTSCLLTRAQQHEHPTSVPGQLFNPDEQCQTIWGPKSYMCRGAEFGNASSICTAMYCRDPSSPSECVLHTAVWGTSCGHKQWCHQGKCVYSKEAPPKRGACILGDQPGPAFNGLTCADLISAAPSYCYQDKVRARCCESCWGRHTMRLGCEYGDRMQGCRPWHCNMVDSSRDMQSECCATCDIGELMTTTKGVPLDVVTANKTEDRIQNDECLDFEITSGQTCKSFIQAHGRFVCYNEQVSKSCCRSCSRISSVSKDCAYGDKTPDLCSRMSNRTKLLCSRFRSHCCESCVYEEAPKGSTSTFSRILFIETVMATVSILIASAWLDFG